MTPALAATLTRELDWLEAVIGTVMAERFEMPALPEGAVGGPPDLSRDPSPYARFMTQHDMDAEARVIAALAIAPHLRPEALDPFLIQNATLERRFTEFGGVLRNSGGIVPTVDTALFVLAASDLDARGRIARLLHENGPLKRIGLIAPDLSGTGGARLVAPGEALAAVVDPDMSLIPRPQQDMAAQRLHTTLDWDDLVLPRATQAALEHVVAWVRHAPRLQQTTGPARLITPGFRTLFYGPPGTGKTLAATLLGQRVERPVFRVDLSKIVSKWIGETEKNLAQIFDQAEAAHWILFFDEADALFGGRTELKSSNDRYANQEVAYILQRIESFTGLAILATNLKSNIDPAFARRFQSEIYFPLPDAKARESLWARAFQDGQGLAPDVDLSQLARDYEITGAMLVNILRRALVDAMASQDDTAGATDMQLTQRDLMAATLKELRKSARPTGPPVG